MILKSILGEEKQFVNKDELISYVKENLTQIIDAKKVEQKSCEKGLSVNCKVLNGVKLYDAEKAIKIDNDYWYIAANTTNILDHHDDLHVKRIWDKTVIDQQGKNYLVADHELKIRDTIVRKEHIEMFVASTTFSALGMPFEGTTQVLVYKFRKDKVIHDDARKWLESGDEIQASVRMQYVVIEFALDSNHPDDAESKKRYDDYMPQVANKADFDYIPYFFVIKEAKNVRESSLVLFGSNPVTGNNIRRKDIEPSADTQNNDVEPLKNTKRQAQLKEMSNKLKKLKW